MHRWCQSIFALSTRARYFWGEEIISPLKVSGLPQVEGYLKRIFKNEPWQECIRRVVGSELGITIKDPTDFKLMGV